VTSKFRLSVPKLAGTLTASVTAAVALTQAHGAPAPVRYACAASEQLSVQRNGASAHVTYAGRRYDLERKRSSIGDKYVSPKAALIIDGNSAVFVAEDVVGLGTCTRAVPLASNR